MHSAQKFTVSGLGAETSNSPKIAEFRAKDAASRRRTRVAYGIILPILWGGLLVLANTADTAWQYAVVAFDAGMVCTYSYKWAMFTCDVEDSMTTLVDEASKVGDQAFQAGIHVGVSACGCQVVDIQPHSQDGTEGVLVEIRHFHDQPKADGLKVPPLTIVS